MNNRLKILLLPVSIVYGLITAIRNLLFDWGILPSKSFDAHTIGVGNLAVGGAGKTPMVEYLIKLILKENASIATLSRGYKRKTSGFILASETSTAEEIGDEPLMYKTKFPVAVAVDAKRSNGIKKLLEENPKPKIILLDDAFQHRYVKCGLNIVVSEFNNLFYNDSMLPSGTLREYKSGIIRADIIVITKTPDHTTPVELRNILKDVNPKPHQQVFFSYIKYGDLFSLQSPQTKINITKDLYQYSIVSFAGIANASPMVNYLKEYANDVKHLPFGDHHEYIPKDLEDIERYYNSIQATHKILVTTEKDSMRLKNPGVANIANRMNIYILPIEMTFKEREEDFNNEILKYVRSNRIYHHKYS